MSDATYRDAVLASSPRAFWPMQESSGLPQDASGNGLHMTSIAAGADYRQPGASSDMFAIRIIGGETIQRSAVVSTVVDDFTMEMVISVEALATADQIVFHNGAEGSSGQGIRGEASGAYRGLAGGVAELGLGSVIAGTGFRHLVVLRRAGTWENYLDGAGDNTSAGTSAPPAPSGTVQLGDGSIQTAYSYVAFYETALSAATIAAHFDAVGAAAAGDTPADVYSWYAD